MKKRQGPLEIVEEVKKCESKRNCSREKLKMRFQLIKLRRKRMRVGSRKVMQQQIQQQKRWQQCLQRHALDSNCNNQKPVVVLTKEGR